MLHHVYSRIFNHDKFDNAFLHEIEMNEAKLKKSVIRNPQSVIYI